MTTENLQKITLGGGCFWCTEAALEQLDGVVKVEPGYMGGDDPSPTYESVCTGKTGHAEVIQITFEPARIDLETLLTAFFTIHDPTTLNRQGHDVGSQYRSAIFCESEAQQTFARQMIARLDAAAYWPNPIVTEVAAAGHFHVAEAYHHQYFRKNPYQGYCMAVAAPKMLKIRQIFPQRLKPADA
jgi:peptide-methionine (S)-S-oxide reductase